ncbi:hypothetical protein [Glaciecola sp. 1036]|uniref:hypothetical protein n=1 Tax=Alteromonadaceae TaxID=72275 RepID=UPI003D05F06D
MQHENANLTQRLNKSSHTIFIWTASWVLSLALLAFGPKFLWDYSVVISLIVILVNLSCGYKMIMANKAHLMAMDELQRRVHMNAMAISLGISMIFGAVYGLLEGIRLIESTPNPANILFVMGISYLVSVFVGFRKYE